jgi:ankyrin repeat protein
MDISEALEFTIVHKIVLGLVSLDLGNYLAAATHEINQPDSSGQTPLFWAATRGDATAVETLLRYGANPNTTSKLGLNALHWAIESKTSACTKLLLEHGARPNQQSCSGATPLHYAAWTHKNPTTHLLPLINFQAGVNAKDRDGLTPLHYAALNDKISPSASLLKHHAPLDAPDNDGYTPLLRAILHNQPNATRFLLESGANPLSRTKKGDTILHTAAAGGGIPTFRAIAPNLACPLDVDCVNSAGLSPIDVLLKRPDRNPELVAAFEDLVRRARSLVAEAAEEESEEEGEEVFYTPPEYPEVSP